MLRSQMPYAPKGISVGLFGGSFDPPHAGHLHVSREALKRFGLDQVWWLVSPGNPLKSRPPAPLERRIAAARSLVTHPRVHVTGIEADLGTRYTAQTIARLKALCPGVRFVWLMGADNLAQLHRWEDWHRIVQSVPLGILARPGQRISARLGVAARIYHGARVPALAARGLARAEAPAWCFVNVPMRDLSSSAIRAKGDWQA